MLQGKNGNQLASIITLIVFPYKVVSFVKSEDYIYENTGCPKPNQTASMGLNYDLGDKSENLRRKNHFEKFNKANRNYFLQKMQDFSSII